MTINDNFCQFLKVVEVYKSIMDYVNAEDCMQRTALHYFSESSSQLSKLPAEEEVLLAANCSDACVDFAGLPTSDIYAQPETADMSFDKDLTKRFSTSRVHSRTLDNARMVVPSARAQL